ncbi:MAG: PPC domain-containing protein [Chloroflexi bacterium]|nr:PPC domain-containing protein [Chloroflexota bacterium]
MPRKPMLWIFGLLLMMLIALPTAAQTETPIAFGETVGGTLTVQAPSAVYRFEGRADDTVTITLESDEFDAFLTLLGPDGAELARDDDGAGGQNAGITAFVLPADGAYSILVDSYNRISTGSYRLTLSGDSVAPSPAPDATLTPAATPQPVTALPIQAGDSVSGTLTREAAAAYTFSGLAGELFTITLTSDDFDAFLTLQDAAGNVLTTDDDRAGNFNARIEAFALPADGDYTIIVGSYRSDSAGEFTLTLERAAVQDGPTPTPTAAPMTDEPAGLRLDMGATAAGSLAAGSPTARYTFNGRAGQVVTITLVSTAFDAYLSLENADGMTLAADDDGAGGSDARIAAFTLPADGLYTIVVGSYTNMESGDFTLTLEEAGEAPPPTPTATMLPTVTPLQPDTPTPTGIVEPTFTPTATPPAPVTDEPASGGISIGQTVSGALTDAAPSAAYSLEGRAGELVSIGLSSDDFDAYLRVLDPSGLELASDDDGGSGLNARIALLQLPADGTYTILAESLNGDTGSYTLVVSAVTIQPIEYTQVVEGTLADESVTIYRFRGQQGDVITLSADSNTFDAYLSLLQPDAANLPLAEDDDSGGSRNALIGPYTLLTTGDYFIAVRSYDDGSGPYTLRLSRATLMPIAYGEVALGEFSSETRALYYSFEGQRGDVIGIRVDSGGTLDTLLSMRGPDNIEVIFDDDGGSGFDPEVNRLMLTQDGRYSLLVKPFLPDETGRVTIALQRQVPLSLDQGAQRIQLNEKRSTDVLTFNGTAGANVRLVVRILADAASAPIITVTQGGITLATADATNVSALTLEFIVPEAGPVSVQVSDANFSRVTLELSLEGE